MSKTWTYQKSNSVSKPCHSEDVWRCFPTVWHLGNLFSG